MIQAYRIDEEVMETEPGRLEPIALSRWRSAVSESDPYLVILLQEDQIDQTSRIEALKEALLHAQQALQRQQDQVALIARHSAHLHEATRLNQLYQFVVEAVTSVLPHDWIMLCVANYEDFTMEAVAGHGFPAGVVRDTVRPLYHEENSDEDILAYVWRTGSMLVTTDLMSPRHHKPTVEKYGLSGSSAVMPMRDRMGIIGTLSILRPTRSGTPSPILEEDLRLLAVFAKEAGIAFENLRLAQRLHQKGERLRDILVHVPAVIWESWEGEGVRALRADFVSDYVHNMLGYTVSEWLSSRDFWLRIIHPDDRETVAQELEEVRRGGERRDLKFRWFTKAGHTIWVETSLLPIQDEGGETIGLRGVTIDISDRKQAEEQISKQQQRLMYGFMNELEEERRVVAYDLHDGLTQYVMASHAFMDTYAKRYRVQQEEMPEDLGKGLKYLSQAVLEARRVVNSLRSLALDELGLIGALEQLLAEEKERAGWQKIDLRHNIQSRRFETVLETAVYRVAQEALGNARKHAETNHVQVSLRSESDGNNAPSRLALEVRDWGKGFEVQAKRKQYDHLGLHSMVERVNLLHGNFEIWSVPGEGTRIRAVFPISPEAAAPPYSDVPDDRSLDAKSEISPG
jgi:PAS domain S-box-containing protein